MSPIDPQVAELIAEMREAREEVRATGANLTIEREELAAQGRQADEERAVAARQGDLGPEWRTIQQRIDHNQTTVAAVLSGEDLSPEAEAIRGFQATNLAALIDETQTSEDPSTVEAFESLAQTIAELQRSLRDLNPGAQR